VFVHAVYFTQTEGLDEAGQRKFLDGIRSLTTLPTVRHGWVGKPAETSREVIDRSYTYALTVVFDDAEGHDAYQVHPDHDVFREECSPYWSDVVIRDSVTLG
jgi:hypothetical protein